MAPDSRFWRHQLGEATTDLQRSMLKPTLSLCLFFTLCSTNLEARTEPVRDTRSEISIPAGAMERPAHGESVMLASLPPTSVLFNTSPDGRWSNRIQIHIPNQPAVQRYIRFYNGEGRRTLTEALERSWPFVPVMSEILESYGVPAEMISVVLVESCFKRQASYRGAGGYWQMLAATARKNGLRVDRWVDERRDPVKSTQAAARYLRSFYEEFNSWTLALAAYNAGSSPVERAVRRWRAKDYWELSGRRCLPSKTRAYVPKVLAAMQIMRNLETHGFYRPRYPEVYSFDSTPVRSPLRLDQVARWLSVPLTDLRDLNPSLRQDCLPPDIAYDLRLPSGAREKFDMAYAEYLRR